MDSYDRIHGGRQPWEHVAQTYAWVVEQEFADMALKNEETVQWVLKQQERDMLQEEAFWIIGADTGPRDFMEFVDGFVVEGDGDIRFEETWKTAMRWQRDAEKVLHEELRRLQDARLEAERCRMAYQRRKAEDQAREQRRKEKERERLGTLRDEGERKAWRGYEERWATINSSAGSPPPERLTFRSIPWPMFYSPHRVEEITPARVAMFVLSPLHSEGQSRKDRIKSALRRWHPDRFGRVLARVNDRDRAAVEEGVGVIVRCLNNLLERED